MRKIEKIEDVFWHDTYIKHIEEDCLNNSLTLHVDYPVNWEKHKYEEGSISFLRCVPSSVGETWIKNNRVIVCEGIPSIDQVDVIETMECEKLIEIRTNQWVRRYWVGGFKFNCSDENPWPHE